MSQTYKWRPNSKLKKLSKKICGETSGKLIVFYLCCTKHRLQANKTVSPSLTKKFVLILLILKSQVPICQGFRPRGVRECFFIDCSDSLIGNRSSVVLATHKIFVSTGKLKLCYFKTDCYSHENGLQFCYSNARKSPKVQF